MQIVGHSNLNGVGKGGEGLALRQYPNGQRVLFLAHESAPMCFSVIDVTNPEDPKVIAQLPVEAESVRCNSLGLSGTTLAVAHQVEKAGQPHAGMDTYDVTDPAHPKKLAYFDTSGPSSRGVHYLWFADGQYAYLSTGAKDFTPHNKDDDQFLMIVDLADPAHPQGDRPLVAAGHARRRQGAAAATRRAVRRRHPHALARAHARAAGPRLSRLDRWRPGDPRHRRQGASEAGGAPLVAVGRQRLRAYAAADSVAQSADPDRGGDGGQLQGLAEAQLGLGHERREAPDPARRLPSACRFFRRCARRAGGSARTTST